MGYVDIPEFCDANTPLRLVSSMNGGAVLIYECECGARVQRTSAQAEQEAFKQRLEVRVEEDQKILRRLS